MLSSYIYINKINIKPSGIKAQKQYEQDNYYDECCNNN